MKVTYEDFFKDPQKYIELAETEEILLVKDGFVYVHIYNPHGDKLKAARSLFGLLRGCDPNDEDLNR